MTIKFAILNISTAQYVLEEDRDAAIEIISKSIVGAYLGEYGGGSFCSLVEVQPDGTEKWFTLAGSPTPSPAEIAAKVAAKVADLLRHANAALIPLVTL